jgi:hypothetical protein
LELRRDGRYVDGMKIAIAMIAAVWAAGPAVAMNWEGHDDWMIDQPEALAFGAAVPEARPLSRAPACGSGALARPDNPYEQVPLPCRNNAGDGTAGEPAERKLHQ